jgi:stage V sporulation protein D (sporulation-specific penicillin-binding protein)
MPKFDIINSADKRFLGFGYGIMATPIQLATAYSIVANAGKMMKPYLVKKIEKGNEIIKEFKPQLIRKTISEETAKTLTDLLVGAVQNGTGAKAYIKDLKIAGKTGTAQILVSGAYSKSNHLASFVGFYPATNPKICMLVLIDNPKTDSYGGSVAAPIFKNIALRWSSISSELLDNLNQENNTQTNENKYVYAPNLVGLTVDDADIIIKELGLKSNIDNYSGIIISQFPRSGTKITKNTSILLKVSTSNNSNISRAENSDRLEFPKVEGLSLRRAISILHNAGFKTKVSGSGTVKEQKWKIEKNNEYICLLICK